MNILFLHGWTSTPGGLKPTYLKDHGHTDLNPALPDDDFDAAVCIAQTEFNQHHPDVVVGSSRGGAVAMNMDTGDTPLVLLCPAWKRWGTASTVKPSTVILHSEQDDVVPFADSQRSNSIRDLHSFDDEARLGFDPSSDFTAPRCAGSCWIGQYQARGPIQIPLPRHGPADQYDD